MYSTVQASIAIDDVIAKVDLRRQSHLQIMCHASSFPFLLTFVLITLLDGWLKMLYGTRFKTGPRTDGDVANEKEGNVQPLSNSHPSEFFSISYTYVFS